ncbi:Transcription termination factor 1 like protein [Argiope bruennichi]|uniref:Transcription termination factor 1 like protein n=1 Tax=Argiope bruennichi TaxID=94029 RepID=A0A8T0EDG0_ARGBR|nr:Transcription termination factor 1 like protein [Argiope bruennichi]
MYVEKMNDSETIIAGVKRSEMNLNSKSVDGFNKQKKKRHKHKLNKSDFMAEIITIESDDALNDVVLQESVEKCIFGNPGDKKSNRHNRKHITNEKKDSFKKKNECKFVNSDDVNDCDIFELATLEKIDNNGNSKKFHKRKNKVTNAENLSNYRNVGINEQELKNNVNAETLMELNQHEKKHKHKSLCVVENVSNYKIQESEEAENNRILNELYKRKSRHKRKLTKNDKMLDCLNTDICDVELSQFDFSSEISNGVQKQKRKKRKKLATEENLPTAICMEANHISNNIMYQESNEEDVTKNSHEENVSKLNRKKNKYSEIESHTYQKRKYSCINDANVFDCEIAETATAKKSHDDVNSKKFHKKKKHKVTDDENMFACRILETDKQELENDTNVKILKSSKKKKKKKDKQKLSSNMENVCCYQESVNDESGKNRIVDVLEVHEKKDKYKQTEVDKLSDSHTADLNIINHNGLNSETSYEFPKKKKKKHKHKLLDEMENISNCNNQELPTDHSSINNIYDILDVYKKDKKTDTEKISDCKTVDLNTIEIDENYLNSKNFNIFHQNKKKKHKKKSLDEIENISNCKTIDSVVVEMNQNNLKGETLNKFHKKKKKKHRHNLHDEMENICDRNIEESITTESGKNSILDSSDVQKGNKQADVDKISDYKSLDSNAIEINQNELSNETFGIHKHKRKKHKHKLTGVENMSEVVESNNTSNDAISQDYIKEKSSVQNLDYDLFSRTKRNKKKHVKSVKIISNDVQEKEKIVSSEEFEKKCQEDAYTSFDTFLYDTNEVPVPFPVPLLHEGETTATIPPEKRAELEENGIAIHDGKWTKAEDNILTRNFQQFGLEFGINNPFQLLGINQHRRHNKLTKFLKAKHFLVRLGKDLNNRTLRSIYMRARKLFDPLNKGKLSAEESIDLKHAHELVGNKWTRISDMLSRSANNCHTAYRWHKKDINKGKWTPDEESNLIKAIKSVTGSEDISANNVKNISWSDVAQHVPTRNEFQCHKHWAGHLAWDSSVTEKKRWQKCHYGKLIYLIKDKYCFNSEQEIDWRELHKHFKHVAPSYIFLRKKWSYLKGRIPKVLQNLDFSKYLNAFIEMYKKQYKIFADVKF